MARSDLTVRYEGPAVASGRMQVRLLAPALLGLAEAIQETGRVLYPDAPVVSLEITATSSGSFVAHLDLARLAPDAAALFAGDPMTALANIKAVLFDPARGVVRFLRLRRAHPDVEPDADGTVTFRDGDTEVTFPADVVKAGTSVAIRSAYRAAVDPMVNDPGIRSVEVTFSPGSRGLTLEAADAVVFDAEPGPDDPIDASEYTAELRIVSLSWDPDLAWRFDDGSHRFPARILDEDFYRSLSRDAYRSGDRLRARVRRIQTDRNGELSTRYEITEVLAHREAPPADVQLRLGDITDDLA